MGQEEGVTLSVQGTLHEDVPSKRDGTTRDKQDMQRVGRAQELNVCKLYYF